VSPATNKQEEPKLTLPAGHPQAGYLSPDLSFSDGFNGAVDDETSDAWDEMIAAREEEAQTIAENEDKVAREEQALIEERLKKDRERLEQIASGKLTVQQAQEQAQAQATLDTLGELEKAEKSPSSSSSKSSS
jgi:predicted aminopeptidase